MKNYFLSLFFVFLTAFSFGQVNKQVDSLIKILPSTNDTNKLAIMYTLTVYYGYSDPELSQKYLDDLFKLAVEKKSVRWEANAHNQKGTLLFQTGNYTSAILSFSTALSLFKIAKIPGGVGNGYQNIGLSYANLGDNEKAIPFYNEAIKVFQGAKKLSSLPGVYNNLGLVFMKQKNYPKAEEYFVKAVTGFNEFHMEANLGNPYLNLGLLKSNLLQYKEGLKYYSMALSCFLKYNDLFKVSATYNDIGNTYTNIQKTDSALFYFKKAVKINKELEDTIGLSSNFLNIAVNYRFERKEDLAKIYLDSCYQLFTPSSTLEQKSLYYLELSYYNFYKNNFIEGVLNNEQCFQYKDSFIRMENVKSLNSLATAYETEKKDLQIKNQSLEIDTKQKENEAKNKILYLGTFTLLIVGLFGFIAFNNYKKTKKANVIINNQKEQVELQKEELSHQKELVEEKQKEIIDSINYAQKIQAAVLTSEEVWKKISPEHFIIFFPKDIVSGDFYWAHNLINNRSVFALADCTGHGVPGGFMSMLGNSFLNELVVENKIFKADEVLNKLRSKIIAALGQKGATDRKDGMDMAICVWNKLNNTLEFSGANNNLWLVRNNELIQYAGDKMPIGQYSEELKPFSSQSIELQKNDLIVLCTDGFSDQFGGESGKKLKSKNLKELIIKGSQNPLEQQKTDLISQFSKWKGNHEQVDDVSLIMIRVV